VVVQPLGLRAQKSVLAVEGAFGQQELVVSSEFLDSEEARSLRYAVAVVPAELACRARVGLSLLEVCLSDLVRFDEVFLPLHQRPWPPCVLPLQTWIASPLWAGHPPSVAVRAPP
jgi:hypothetical protein